MLPLILLPVGAALFHIGQRLENNRWQFGRTIRWFAGLLLVASAALLLSYTM